MPKPLTQKLECYSEEDLRRNSKLILKNPKPLFSTYRMRLKISKIDGIHSPPEVFNESYSRIASMLKNGKTVSNLLALYYAVGYRVVLEYSNSNKRQNKIREKIKESWRCFNQEGQNNQEEFFDKIRKKILNRVSQFEARLIFLYTTSEQRITWEEVCQKLIDEGSLDEKVISERLVNRIKKQYSRALQKIKLI